MTDKNYVAQAAEQDLAHEIWATAQTPPGEPVEAAVARVRALLPKLRAEGVQAGDERESEHIETLQRMRADYNPSDGPMSELKATALDAAIAALASAPVAGEAREGLAPPKCPITGRPFFMALEHAELGSVPTYGGPYDSYTIPHLGGKADQPWHERELRVYRYDHDLGGWRTDEVEVIPLRIVHEDVLNERHDAAPQASEAVRTCTCHPDDRPAGECQKKYAAQECQTQADKDDGDGILVSAEELGYVRRIREAALFNHSRVPGGFVQVRQYDLRKTMQLFAKMENASSPAPLGSPWEASWAEFNSWHQRHFGAFVPVAPLDNARLIGWQAGTANERSRLRNQAPPTPQPQNRTEALHG